MTRIASVFLVFALYASTVAAAPPPPPPMPGQGPGPVGPPPLGQSDQPAPTATTDPALLSKAKTWFTQLQAGKIDRSALATGPNANMTDASVASAQKMLGGLGPPVSFVQEQAESQGNVDAAIYLVTFKNGQKVDFLFAVDKNGKVAGLSLGTPH
jgi:hypothetical protein